MRFVHRQDVLAVLRKNPEWLTAHALAEEVKKLLDTPRVQESPLKYVFSLRTYVADLIGPQVNEDNIQDFLLPLLDQGVIERKAFPIVPRPATWLFAFATKGGEYRYRIRLPLPEAPYLVVVGGTDHEPRPLVVRTLRPSSGPHTPHAA